MKPFSRLFPVPNAHLVENDHFKWPPYRRGTNEYRPELVHFSTLDSSTASPLKISTSSAKCVKLLSSLLSNVILCPILTDGDTLAPTEPCPPCKKTVHWCSSEGGFWVWFREKQKEGSTRGRGWISIQIPDILQRRKDVKSKLTSLFLKVAPWTLSKGGGEASFQSKPPETLQILLFPLQRTVSWVPRRQWVESGIFFGTNSTAVHLLIEPGSQREAQYRTLFLSLHLSY